MGEPAELAPGAFATTNDIGESGSGSSEYLEAVETASNPAPSRTLGSSDPPQQGAAERNPRDRSRRYSSPEQLRSLSTLHPSSATTRATVNAAGNPNSREGTQRQPGRFYLPRPGEADLVTVSCGVSGAPVRFPAIYHTLLDGRPLIFAFSRPTLGETYFGRAVVGTFDLYALHGFDRPATLGQLADLPASLVRVVLESINNLTLSGPNPESLARWQHELWKPDSPHKAPEACPECGLVRNLSLADVRNLRGIAGGVFCSSFGKVCQAANSRCTDNPSRLTIVGRENRMERTGSVGSADYPSGGTRWPGFPPPERTPASRQDLGSLGGRENENLPPLYVAGQPLQAPNYMQALSGGDLSYGYTMGTLLAGSGGAPGRTALRTPHPNHFLRGNLAQALNAPGGTEEERQAYASYRQTPGWERLYTAMQRALQVKTLAPFTAKEGVTEYTKWKTSLVAFYRLMGVANTIAQTQLAVATFQDTASMWWWAHYEHTPERLYSLAQLFEWVSIELVPAANLESGFLEWGKLTYHSDLEEYFRQVRELTIHHPMPPLTAHLLAANPFGEILKERLKAAHAQAGPGGINTVKWETIVRAYVTETEKLPTFIGWGTARCEPRFRDPKVQVRQVQASSPPPGNTAFPDLADEEMAARINAVTPEGHQSSNTLYGESPRPCFCCGKAEHSWTECAKRIRGSKCGRCGSNEHPTFRCFKRYQPAPESRINCIISLPADQLPEGITVLPKVDSGGMTPGGNLTQGEGTEPAIHQVVVESPEVPKVVPGIDPDTPVIHEGETGSAFVLPGISGEVPTVVCAQAAITEPMKGKVRWLQELAPYE